METKAFFDELGGAQAVADHLGLKRSAINVWTCRNHAPWKFRPQIAVLAKRKKVALPAGFLGDV